MTESIDIEALLEAPFYQPSKKHEEKGYSPVIENAANDLEVKVSSDGALVSEKEHEIIQMEAQNLEKNQPTTSLSDPDRKHRSRSRDRKHRSRSRERKHRSRSRERKHRSRSRERHHHRSKKSRRDRSRERERSKERGNRDQEKYRESGRDRHREKEKDEEGGKVTEIDKERSSYRSRSRGRGTKNGDKSLYDHKSPTPEPSPAETEEARDRRTVFVMQLSKRLRKGELDDFFSVAGKVRVARIIEDKYTGRSKGVGYVEFHEESSVAKALSLTGQRLKGVPVIVQVSQAEKNRLAAKKAAEQQSITNRTIEVTNLHTSLTASDIKLIFEPFGSVDEVEFQPNFDSTSKKVLIVFAESFSADKAQSQMNGFILAGQQIQTSLVRSVSHMDNPKTNFLDDGIAGGFVSLSFDARARLMQNLGRGEVDLPFFPPASSESKPTMSASTKPPLLSPSRALLLKNLFNPYEETEPNWDADIAEDVKDECSKYGQISHVFVDKYTAGHVYLLFDQISSSIEAFKCLNGRYFAAKMIQAEYIDTNTYFEKFPDVK